MEQQIEVLQSGIPESMSINVIEAIDIQNSIHVLDLGRVNYQKAWDFQKDLQSKRIRGEVSDTLILAEHEPVYTLGKNADENHILQNHPRGIKTYRVERGGDVTFHGPGQLVGYPILNLQSYRPSIRWYMQTLEEVIIGTLAEFGIPAGRKKGLTGVWVDDEKIAALGVRISRWVTMHGFALNVNTDLSYYDGIIPCGISEWGVTSMEKITGKQVSIDEVKQVISGIFLTRFIPTSGSRVF